MWINLIELSLLKRLFEPIKRRLTFEFIADLACAAKVDYPPGVLAAPSDAGAERMFQKGWLRS
ncbi:MAG: hypothetical protein EpisKO_03670 [Epibacterium sp.]